ncbi:hypothetical protein K435DRAFT_658207 [Dendrothele bispora CBS 962.96]|uniref:Uncharacterized protein n=1 Tax=Dendrothele bispora (strain CBS 962.96) TaxID=1314807 RepID=A0A4S8MCY5_DENBC|nr:hypothetical protein K435DRAFT_658207 [Dendrothele bispora CBS 962.96]
MPETELDKEPQDADAIPQNVIYVDSELDYFGIYRSYPETTATIPDEEVPISDICVGPSLPSAPLSGNPYSVFGTVLSNARSFVQNLFTPFSNASEYRLISWFYRRDSKSLADLDDLVQNVLLAGDFQLEDLEGFSTVRIMRQMDEHRGARAAFREEDGWIESSVKIPLPAEGFCVPESEVATLEIDGIFHRDMLDVITSVFESPASNNFHYSPHKLHRQQFPRSASPEHLRSKLYDSDAFIREYESVTQAEHKRRQSSPPTSEDPDVPIGIASIMCWSDSTHLSSFGDKSAWPVYMYLGNQSKYERGKPSAFAAHHIAYILKVKCFFTVD